MSKVLKVAVPVPLRTCFDYLPPKGEDPDQLRPGIRLLVPFGPQRLCGILVDVADSSELEPARLKAAFKALDSEPLFSSEDLALIGWASRYYHYPIGEAFAAALAPQLREGHSAAPKTVRRLVPDGFGGPDAAALVKGSPRQAELLRRLWETPEGLLPEALDGLGRNWRSIATALIGKGLAAWQEGPPPLPVAEPAATPAPPLALNEGQEQAVAAVSAALGRFQAFLLDGVTGSGKTEVYLRLAAEVIGRGQQVMVLVPEISLTPQLEARFRARLAAPIVVYHSGLSEAERRRAWLAMRSGEAAILLGTRSSAFTPLKAPGLIVLDEEHDPSFKQHEYFRFSARDVAVMRAHLLKVPVLLGSATPSLESSYNASLGRYHLLRLPTRAGGAAAPGFRLVDIRNQRLTEGISKRLAADIGEALAKGEQTLLFVNRRGYAPTLICHACGWVAHCQNCDANLVIHYQEHRLRCHHCGLEQALATSCGKCGNTEIMPLGLGTERIEGALAKLFPKARVARIDRDSVRRVGELERVLADIHAGQIDILVGTQMLAKGHHFPKVTLVGIVNLDAGLFSTDFRAGERTAQLIVQVAGRAGREDRPGTVVLQTRQPDHPLLRTLIRDGYAGFAALAVEERRVARLPPFSYQAFWRADAAEPETANGFLKDLAEWAGQIAPASVWVMGPAPAPLARRANRHRFQLLLQSERRAELHGTVARLLEAVPGLLARWRVQWSLDIDPVDTY
jgi:primosomal protein N' (replication factor Y)